MVYEGYGPCGVAVIVEALTDNKNRTAGDLRHYFDKCGGNLGQTGCVSFMFSEKGVIVIDNEDEKYTEDQVMEDCMEAGAEDDNLIICVTTSDELNILAGLMAKKMGTRHTIARVRNPDYSLQRDFMRNQLGFSMIVNPELEAASEICRVLSFPSAVKVDTFSRGKVELAEFFVEDHSRLNGVELNQLHKITKANILICAVSHNEDEIIPDGNYAIKPGDHLYITGTHRDLSRFCLDIGVITNRIKNVIIVVGIKTCFIF